MRATEKSKTPVLDKDSILSMIMPWQERAAACVLLEVEAKLELARLEVKELEAENALLRGEIESI